MFGYSAREVSGVPGLPAPVSSNPFSHAIWCSKLEKCLGGQVGCTGPQAGVTKHRAAIATACHNRLAKSGGV